MRPRDFVALALLALFVATFAFYLPRTLLALMALGCFLAVRLAVRAIREIHDAERRQGGGR